MIRICFKQYYKKEHFKNILKISIKHFKTPLKHIFYQQNTEHGVQY